MKYLSQGHSHERPIQQEFVKIKSWLLLNFSAYLHNQLKFNYKVFIFQ